MENTKFETDLEAAEFLRDARERIINELKKQIIGQTEVVDQLLIALFFSRSLSTCWCAGVSQDIAHKYFCSNTRTPIQSHPIHARPNAIRYYWNRYY